MCSSIHVKNKPYDFIWGNLKFVISPDTKNSMHSQNDTVSKTKLKTFWLSTLKFFSFCIEISTSHLQVMLIVTLT